MRTIIVEQFNPRSQCWNKLYEVDSDEFDPEAPIAVDKYGGPYRTRSVGETPIPVIIEDEEVFEEEPLGGLEEDWFNASEKNQDESY